MYAHVMGIRGEPAIPENAAEGLVWSAIVAQIDRSGSRGDFVSVSDLPRERLATHPWSIGGGGAAELKEQLGHRVAGTLGDLATTIGRTTHTGEDDVFYLQPSGAKTLALDKFCIPLVTGENVRDYAIEPSLTSVFPYDRESGDVLVADGRAPRDALLAFPDDTQCNAVTTGKRPLSADSVGSSTRCSSESDIAHSSSVGFPFVATHNHFVLDRGGKVFNQYGTGNQAAGRRRRRRPSGAVGLAQQLHGVLLDEAGSAQQGRWRNRWWSCNRRVGTVLRVRRNEAPAVPAGHASQRVTAWSHPPARLPLRRNGPRRFHRRSRSVAPLQPWTCRRPEPEPASSANR